MLDIKKKNSANLNSTNFKGATKLYFSCVTIILFNTGLYKFSLSTYFFGKTVFRSSAHFVFSVLFCVEFELTFTNFNKICMIII